MTVSVAKAFNVLYPDGAFHKHNFHVVVLFATKIQLICRSGKRRPKIIILALYEACTYVIHGGL